MSVHTPGPWACLHGSVYTQPLAGAPIAPIARMDREAGNGTSPVERDANAHLIAAAPELLDALEEVLGAAYAEGYTLPTWIDDAARAALAKARGEEVQP